MESQSVRITYRSLQTPTEIRILRLLPGRGQEPLLCAIEHVDVDKASYEALSYVWGSDVASCRVAVGPNQHASINASLHNALRDLRSAVEPRLLWADAICIDQSNLRERSQQVALMGTIYRNAVRVVTYIGKRKKGVSQGLVLAQEVWNYAKSHLHEEPDSRLLEIEDDEAICGLGFPSICNPKWKALRYLMGRPWSTRIWIVQESLLNKNMIMVYGRTVIPWDVLPDLSEFVTVGRVPSLVCYDAAATTAIGQNLAGGGHGKAIWEAASLFALADLRKASSQGNLPLLRLLKRCRQLNSTDTRDQVYALLGIATDSDKLGIVPDYSASVTDVYISTAVRILQTYPNLDLLSAVKPKKSLKLPSWVPDWSPSLDLDHIAIAMADFPLDPGIYCASAKTTSCIAFDPYYTRLTLSGGLIDKVSHTSERLALILEDQKIALFEEHVRKAKHLQIYRSEDDAINAFWRTIIWNTTHEYKEATREYKRWFEMWLGDMGEEAESPEEGLQEEVEGSANFTKLDQFCAALWLSNLSTLSTTQKGYFCVTPPNTRIGDDIYILLGGRMPFVVRRVGDGFILIGETYVHGLMKGEAFELKDFSVEKIALV